MHLVGQKVDYFFTTVLVHPPKTPLKMGRTKSVKSKNDLRTISEVVAHWSLQHMDAPCGSKSGLVFLDWCDGGAGE